MKKAVIIGGGVVGQAICHHLIKKGIEVTLYTTDSKNNQSKNSTDILGDFIIHKKKFGTFTKWGGVIAVPENLLKLNSSRELLNKVLEFFELKEIYSFKNKDYFIHAKTWQKKYSKPNKIVFSEVKSIRLRNNKYLIGDDLFDICVIATGSSSVPEIKDDIIYLKCPDKIFDKVISLQEISKNLTDTESRLMIEDNLVHMCIPISLPIINSVRDMKSSFSHILLKSRLISRNMFLNYFLNFRTYFVISIRLIFENRRNFYFKTTSLKKGYPIKYISAEKKVVINDSIKNLNSTNMFAYHYESRINKPVILDNFFYEHLTEDFKVTYSNPVFLRLFKILYELENGNNSFFKNYIDEK